MIWIGARTRTGKARILTVGVLLLIGLLAGAVSSIVRGPSYTSEAALSWNPSVRSQIDPAYSAPDPTTFDREVADQADVILSDAVVSKVVADLHTTAAAVRSGIDVTTTAGKSEILIAGSGSTAAAARDLTRSVTDSYVATLRSRNLATLNQRIAALKPVIAALRKQLTDAGSSAESGALADDIATLQSQQAGYTVAAADVPVEVVVEREAVLPAAPASLSTAVSAAIGGALGLILAVCLLLLVSTRTREPVDGVDPYADAYRAPVMPATSREALSRPAPTGRPINSPRAAPRAEDEAPVVDEAPAEGEPPVGEAPPPGDTHPAPVVADEPSSSVEHGGSGPARSMISSTGQSSS